MREVDIKQIAVNNHIYNMKKEELNHNDTKIEGKWANIDKERVLTLKKVIESGSYILDYKIIFEIIFKLEIFRVGFMNFLQRMYLKNTKSYTTATGNLILQDALNVMYLKQYVNFDKYKYILVETNEAIITDRENQLNKELILRLPENATMLTPYDEIVNIVNTIGWNGLSTMVQLIHKVNIHRI